MIQLQKCCKSIVAHSELDDSYFNVNKGTLGLVQVKHRSHSAHFVSHWVRRGDLYFAYSSQSY